MLVLSRKKGESLIMNHDIVVTVVEVRGDKVRLGISAPAEVSIHRREVYEALLAEGREGELREAGKALSRASKARGKANA